MTKRLDHGTSGSGSGEADKNSASESREQKAYRRSGWGVVVLAAIGLALSVYLYTLHVGLLMGEIKSGPLCGTDHGMGCHSVASSPYSSFLSLPLASWGAIYYCTLILLGIGGIIFWRDCGRAFLRWAFLLTVAALAADIFLAYIMVYEIGVVCWGCAATYAINMALILILARCVWKESRPRAALFIVFPGFKDTQGIDYYYRNAIKGLLIGGALLAATVSIAGSQFLARTVTENDRERLTRIKRDLAAQKPKFIDVNNRPALGPDDAGVSVVEFSDFRCPYCGRAAKYLKLANTGSRDDVQLVFRHFPLDKSCNTRLRSNVHPGACLLAEGSACAHEQSRFWEYHDAAFESKGAVSRPMLVDMASGIGLDTGAFEACLDSGRAGRVVAEDIQAAWSAGVKSTPTLFINGRRLRGVQKPWVLRNIFQYATKTLAPPKPPEKASP